MIFLFQPNKQLGVTFFTLSFYTAVCVWALYFLLELYANRDVKKILKLLKSSMQTTNHTAKWHMAQDIAFLAACSNGQ